MDSGKEKAANSNASQSTEDSREVRKKLEKDRKKGEKKLDQFMKSLVNLTPEEKIDALCKKHVEFCEEIRTYKGSVQTLQRRIAVLEREKEQLQNEQSKGVLARSRLETLCRELQRQNKSIKDESIQKIREEEEKRKEVSTRFQTALNEVSVMMQKNTEKNLKLRDDNIEISHKFQKLCEQFKQREEEVSRLTKQMDLEKQLADATVRRIECQLTAEREGWYKEKNQYALSLKNSEEEKAKLEASIKHLEENLSMYSMRYDEFESTISKSNQVFDSYKAEMSRMTKQVNKLERESSTWKGRWGQAQRAYNQAVTEHRYLDETLKDREKKIKNLTDLCRSIQDERAAYLKQLKENGLTPVSVTPVPKEHPQPKSKPAKMTKKEKDLAFLKQELAALEVQFGLAQKASQITEKSDDQTADTPTVQTAAKSDSQTAEKPANQPATKSDTQPAGKSGNESAEKSAIQPATKSDTQPAGKSAIQPATNSDTQPAGKSSNEIAEKPANETVVKSDNRAAGKSGNQIGGKPDKQTAGKSDDQIVECKDKQTATKSDDQIIAESDSQAVGKSENQIVENSDKQPVGESNDQIVERPDKQPAGKSNDQIVEKPGKQTAEKVDIAEAVASTEQKNAEKSVGGSGECMRVVNDGKDSEKSGDVAEQENTELPKTVNGDCREAKVKPPSKSSLEIDFSDCAVKPPERSTDSCLNNVDADSLSVEKGASDCTDNVIIKFPVAAEKSIVVKREDSSSSSAGSSETSKSKAVDFSSVIVNTEKGVGSNTNAPTNKPDKCKPKGKCQRSKKNRHN